jgi:ABC-type lipoprotein release transport system permease subunit
MSDATSNGSNMSTSMIIVIVWVLGGVVFVLLPCLMNRYQRELWWKRLRNCSWSVEIEPEPEAAWLTRARARYEEQQ